MNLPIITVEGDNLPKVWEDAVLRLWKEGTLAYTEYDQWSRDCTMLMVVCKPFSEPRIHLGGICGGLDDLRKYVKEVVEGSEDHFVYEGKRPYEYHERLCNYSITDSRKVDQIQHIIMALSRRMEVQLDGNQVMVFGFSRRAQAITWKPWIDQFTEHPPCLQRVWCRIINDELIMETCWRSRDAYKAAFWNMFALTEMQKRIAEGVSDRFGVEVKPGAYVDFSNSFHIYEKDFGDVESRFAKLVRERSFEKRTLPSLDG